MSRYPEPKKFTPENKEKYIGDVNNIVMRSSWEIKFAKWCDKNPSIINWNSESVIVPYYSELDNKLHRYFVDFAMTMKDADGNLKKYLVEIKPKVQTLPPVFKGKVNKKRMLEEVFTYETNQAKWKQARIFCQKNDMEFVVLTEVELGIK